MITRFRRGATAAEFALILPVMMMLLVAVVDLTNQMNIAFDVQQAARDGAHVGANTTLGPDEDGTVIVAAAKRQAQAVLDAGGWTCPGGIEADWRFDDEADYWVVEVTVECPYSAMVVKTDGAVTARFIQLAQQRGLTP